MTFQININQNNRGENLFVSKRFFVSYSSWLFAQFLSNSFRRNPLFPTLLSKIKQKRTENIPTLSLFRIHETGATILPLGNSWVT